MLDHIDREIRFALTKASVLALAAARSCQPYSTMAPLAGYHHRDPNYHAQLGRLMEEDHADGLAFRSALVINKDLGRPGGQFFEKARLLGHKIARTPQDEAAFHQSQLQLLGVI